MPHADVEERRAYYRAYREKHKVRLRAKWNEWRRNNKECRRNEYAGVLRRRFGLSTGDYEELLLAQQGVCAICGEANAGSVRLSVDHCHKSGRVRGLLCAMCNVGLGSFRDRADLLDRAAEYLLQNAASNILCA